MGITYEHLHVKQARLSLPGDEGHAELAAHLNARAGICDDEYGAYTGNEAIIIGDDGGGCVLYGSPEEVAEALIAMTNRLYPGIRRMCVPGNTLDDADAPSHASASNHPSLPERMRMRQRAQYRERMRDIMPAPWLDDLLLDFTTEDLLIGAAAEILGYDTHGQLDEEEIQRGHLLDPRRGEHDETSLLLIDDEEVVCELEQVRMRFDLDAKDIPNAALPG